MRYPEGVKACLDLAATRSETMWAVRVSLAVASLPVASCGWSHPLANTLHLSFRRNGKSHCEVIVAQHSPHVAGVQWDAVPRCGTGHLR
eukprot:1419209-Amphidinium_carterae.1